MEAPIALVTGATSGIGAHIARELAGQGWTVLVGARDADRGIGAAEQFGGRVLVLDVTDADTISAAAEVVPDLDVLINNAGISLDTGSPVTETDVEIFRLIHSSAAAGGDPAEAAAGAIRLAQLPADGPTGLLFSWDGTVAPW